MGTTTVPVKTYIPPEQKTKWEEHAAELGMSQSEFIKTMVQAGRRGFTLAGPGNRPETRSERTNPRGNGLESTVQNILTDGTRTWDQLLDAVRGDLEDQLEEALDTLQDRNRVKYSGRDGGYMLIDE